MILIRISKIDWNKIAGITKQSSVVIQFRFKIVQLKCELKMKLIFCVILALALGNLNFVDSNEIGVDQEFEKAS